jgi:hypothetical protein
MKLFLIFIFLLFFLACISQNTNNKLIYRGQLVSNKILFPLSNLAVYNKNKFKGTFTDSTGNFNIYYSVGDTLICTGTAYKKTLIVISNNYTPVNREITKLSKKNILLKEKTIYPWPSKEQFKDELLNLKIVTPILNRVKKNLSKKTLLLKQEAYIPGAYLNYKWFLEKKTLYK